MRLRDIEVANDDYERKQRNTESTLEDMESKYNQTLERGVMLEEEVKSGEQEREALRIETQRLRDELSDMKIETDIVRDKLKRSETSLESGRKPLRIDAVARPASPRSELSPTGTTTSSPSFDTPPTKTASSSGLSDTPTPPSPPVSEKSVPISKPFITPSIPKTRLSITSNTTPRPSAIATRTPVHGRTPSVAVNGRSVPSSSFRQSLSKPGQIPRSTGLPQSQSIVQLRSLRSRMQNLEARVHNARSKLPAPTDTPPKASPRPNAVLSNIPSSVTVRSSRKRQAGSTISGAGSLPDQEQTPSQLRPKSSRTSFGHPPATPNRDMLPPRPSSRASASSRLSFVSGYVPGHSRPGSRASISNLRGPLGTGAGSTFAPNASTDRVRPKSSLSNHGYDGTVDEDDGGDDSLLDNGGKDFATPTPRRSTLVRPRTSDVGVVGSAIPSPNKRLSFGPKVPAAAAGRRQSWGMSGRVVGSEVDVNAVGAMRPPSRLDDVKEGEVVDASETY